MSKIKLYIATTIDGFIAREDGSLDWLFEIPNPDKTDYGYNKFYSGIDVVVMGRTTYEDVLGFDVEWPYNESKTFVATSDKNYRVKTKNTEVINRIDNETISRIKAASHKNVWLVGGGKVITAFLNNETIDEMILSVIPVVLGKGIRLFPGETKETRFQLTGTKAFETGVVNLEFQKQASH